MKTRPHVSGRLVQRSEGYEAFIPAPLPPRIELTPRLVRCLSDADRLIGQLAGEGRRLPNPHLLMRPFVKREAVLSSRIEGTQATLGELLAADAGAPVERSPADLREVANYVTALEYGIKRLNTLPLSLRLVKELHEHLMRGVRGDQATPGEFRRSQNWIGPPGCTLLNASYVPPPAGNGRVGRLLITLFLVERRILPTPLLYLSAFFEATRSAYYDGLAAVTRKASWNPWLEYFLNGVARMSEDALSRAERINGLLVKWREAVAGRSQTPLALVDLLAENPFCTVGKVSERLGIAYTTAQRAVERLVALNILKQLGDARRDRVYCATRIMSILDEPPALAQA